jgi:hypothetical protein
MESAADHRGQPRRMRLRRRLSQRRADGHRAGIDAEPAKRDPQLLHRAEQSLPHGILRRSPGLGHFAMAPPFQVAHHHRIAIAPAKAGDRIIQQRNESVDFGVWLIFTFL